ncbi:hypothetical protein [Croceicoccus gelatinilyticus]|uniref:hypothetical protein n=1 Tax=Croceicoccus gelatinilyticus TaxID=2835536 RepID=UPI001BCDBAAB|nr:hypothetical protein [Croceicoccus gelatinilyticus]MBS7671611.1 hypothetical protein [Croceicoccus gelatinilyticus]
MQTDLFVGELERPPVMVAWGGGVDSTAMIIEMHARGEPIDIVLFADTFSERPWTYKAIEIFAKWLAERGIRFERVFYQASKFKNYPPYLGLLENCLTNGTLPSIAFGFGSCSLKNKVQPQNAFAKTWEPAVNAWRQGTKVIKCIGYDCSPADQKRYAEREGYADDSYVYRYPLREWGWTRKECEERILQEGLPVVKKSACFFCTATKPEELLEYEPELLRIIVLMEARAKPRLKTTEGLWRKAVKGLRGATPRPGDMTSYIREKGLLPADEVDYIVEHAPTALISWQEAHADVPLEERPNMRSWIEFFDGHIDKFRKDGVVSFYQDAPYADGVTPPRVKDRIAA